MFLVENSANNDKISVKNDEIYTEISNFIPYNNATLSENNGISAISDKK